MGVFEDFNRFLEARLDEFLRNNPHLELQALEDKLQEQEEEALRLLTELRIREKQLQDQILETAQEVQRWHVRIEKAKSAGRLDLAKPAEEREAALLRQGNQQWAQLEIIKQRSVQTVELQQQIQRKRREVQAKVAEAQAARPTPPATTPPQTEQQWQTAGWNHGYPYGSRSSSDPLESQFRQWEMDEELEDLKRSMGR